MQVTYSSYWKGFHSLNFDGFYYSIRDWHYDYLTCDWKSSNICLIVDVNV